MLKKTPFHERTGALVRAQTWRRWAATRWPARTIRTRIASTRR